MRGRTKVHAQYARHVTICMTAAGEVEIGLKVPGTREERSMLGVSCFAHTADGWRREHYLGDVVAQHQCLHLTLRQH